jgi:hypothetical protein
MTDVTRTGATPITPTSITPASPTPAAISPLRQRMIDDMTLRHFGEKTQHDYIRVVRKGRGEGARCVTRLPHRRAPAGGPAR